MEQILSILFKEPNERSCIDLENLQGYFLKFNFFQELSLQDESNFLLTECVKSVKLESFFGDVCVKSGIFVVLSGALVFQNPDLESCPKLYRRNLNQNLKDSKASEEILIEAGVLFGEIGKNKKYSIMSDKECYVAILTDENYSAALQKYEESINEKIEILKTLEIFHH